MPKVYSLQVSGISCVNCAANLKKILTDNLGDPDVQISVNVMSEKVTLTVEKEQTVFRSV